MYRTVTFVCLLVACSGDSEIQDIGPHIVGGTDANIEDFPYQVSLRYRDSHICGASIISVNWTLSAGHCVLDNYFTNRYTVRVGSSLVSSGGAVHKVAHVIRHQKYNSNTIDYDFALFKIATSFEYSLQIAEIALPVQGHATAIGSNAVVSGWGRLSSKGRYPQKLQKVILPVVSTGVCNAAFPGSITDRMICAGGGTAGRDSCQGDSGGPMMFNNILIGVVSWGRGCALPWKPGVYAKVSSVRDWIDVTMNGTYSDDSAATPVDVAVLLLVLCLATSFVAS